MSSIIFDANLKDCSNSSIYCPQANDLKTNLEFWENYDTKTHDVMTKNLDPEILPPEQYVARKLQAKYLSRYVLQVEYT